MKIRKICVILFLVLLFCVPVTLLVTGRGFVLPARLSALWDGSWFEASESFLRRALPFAQQLADWQNDIRYRTGQREFDGLILTENGLIRQQDPPVDDFVEGNNRSIKQFYEYYKTAAYFTVIPTASAIRQQAFSDLIPVYNQKELLDAIYRSMTGSINTVDTYAGLFDNMDKYIYYRTEDALTALGGYYVYSSLISRMGGNAIPLSEFEVEYLPRDYYGALARDGYQNRVKADQIAVYHYTKYDRWYKMTKYQQNGDTMIYHTIYPTHRLWEDPRSICFGGDTGRMDVSVISPYQRSLLVIGDDTANAYLPMLLQHYNRVTFADLEHMTDEQIERIDILSYDQVLIAYSYQTYTQTQIPQKLQLLY